MKIKTVNLTKLERIIKATANRRRLAILRYLKNINEASVHDIASQINLSFKATSKHLGILATTNIIEHEQRSLYVFYKLSQKQHPATAVLITLL